MSRLSVFDGKLALHDVADVELLVLQVFGRLLSKHEVRLRSEDLDDLVAYGIEGAWRLAQRHDPRQSPFSSRLRLTLNGRYVDWVRKQRGRTLAVEGRCRLPARGSPARAPPRRSRRRPQQYGPNTGRHSPLSGGDPQAACDSPLAGLDEDGVREAARDTALIRVAVDRVARGRVAVARDAPLEA